MRTSLALFTFLFLSSCIPSGPGEPPRGCAALGLQFLPPSIDDSAKLLIQEYWQDGEARYLVFNLNPEARTLWVYEYEYPAYSGCGISEPGTGALLAGPWEIPALSSRTFDARALEIPEDRYHDRDLAFHLGDGSSIGGLPSPIRPAFETPPPAFAVSTPGNGQPWSTFRNIWEKVPSLLVDADASFETRLSLPGDFSYAQIRKDATSGHWPFARNQILDACSSELRIVDLADEIWIFRDGATTGGRFEVTLHWRAPHVALPTLAQLPIVFCAPRDGYACEDEYPPRDSSVPSLIVMP